MTLPITITVYAPGAGGVPSTSSPIAVPPLQSYTHTITATGGFESMAAACVVDRETALDWLANGLMRSVAVYGPENTTFPIWEGYLTQIDATFGQEQRSVSLDAMGNRVRVKYTTVLGTPGTTSSVSDTASQALYGVKDLVLSIGEYTATAAANLAAVFLADKKNPKMTPGTTVATGDLGEVSLTLTGAGWYTTFDWLVTSNSSTSSVSTTTQIQNLTTTYNATNNFFSSNYADIAASGISDQEYIEADTTYREKIEKLLNQGTGTQRLVYGIYEGRQWKVAQWAGALPATLAYRRYLGDGQVYDKNGGVVQPWDVRPDAMYEVVDLLDPGPVSTAQDAAARFYVERVTCTVSADSVGVTLEPSDVDDISARLARIG